MESRKDIEAAVLAECIWSDAFPDLVHVLSEQNFKHGEDLPDGGKLHKLIWNAMLHMYPHTPINIITVFAVLEAQYNYTQKIPLFRLHDSLFIGKNHLFYAFWLLEDSIRTAFKELIQELLNTIDLPKPADRLLVRDSLISIQDEIGPQNDIFDLINCAETFLDSQLETQKEAETVKDFNASIDLRYMEIRKDAQIKMIMTNLDRLRGFPAQKKQFLSALVDVIHYVMLAPQISKATEETILHLKRTIK